MEEADQSDFSDFLDFLKHADSLFDDSDIRYISNKSIQPLSYKEDIIINKTSREEEDAEDFFNFLMLHTDSLFDDSDITYISNETSREKEDEEDKELRIDLDRVGRYLEDFLIPKDNSIEDSSAQYLNSFEISELPDIVSLRPPNIGFFKFFSPCSIVAKSSWEHILITFNAQNDDVENIIKSIHGKCTNSNQYKRLLYYQARQTVIYPVSKRIGEKFNIRKFYCYCPICETIFCIGKKEEYIDVLNLLECTTSGEELMKKVNAEIDILHKNRKKLRGYCHGFWREKQRILQEKYNIVWYSPSYLHPGTKYD